MTKNESVAWYTNRDLILYSLGIGCGGDSHHIPSSSSTTTNGNDTIQTNINDKQEKRFIYEHDNNYEVFPIYPLALAFQAIPLPNDGENRMNIMKSPKQNYFDIRPFPPPSMQGGILPSQFIRQPSQEDDEDGNGDEVVDINSYPAIHIAQTLTIHHSFPIPQQQQDEQPVGIYTTTEIISVLPKSIGTFVTTQTEFFHLSETEHRNDTQPTLSSSPWMKLCTATSTVLLLGISPSLVLPYHKVKRDKTKKDVKAKQQKKHHKKSKKQSSSPPDKTIRYEISKSQPFLYRLSGDYNPIHVDVDAMPPFLSSMLEEEEQQQEEQNADENEAKSRVRPILHGLCTLGYAIRAALTYLNEKTKLSQQQEKEGEDGSSYKINVIFVNCSFVKPLPMGDAIRVLLWEEEQQQEDDEGKHIISANKKVRLRFRVVNDVNGQVVVDGGNVEAIVRNTTTLSHKTAEDSLGHATIARSKL